MKKLKSIGTLALASTLLMTSCKKDDNTTPSTDDTSYDIPTIYSFTDASGASTVDFSGQTQRLDMFEEMITYIKTGNTLGTFLNADTMKAMYNNTYSSWTNASLVGISKQLKDKTAAGDAGVQQTIEDYMDSAAVLSLLNYSNSSQTYGQGGVWTNGTKSYLQSGAGFEYREIIEKTLMCAVSMNQMTVNYLGTLADDDNTNLVTGKTYTEMQHHWDEAYGYFVSTVDFPTTGTDRFWGEYASGRETILGSATKLSAAFRKGRAAIDNKDYTTRDEQITIIRNEIEKVCAGTAIHYLNAAKTNIASPIVMNHALSEAKGFIDGLRYGYNSINTISISATEINTALGYLGTSFATITLGDLNNAIDLLASKTGLESVKTSL